MSRLSSVDLSLKLKGSEYERRLATAQTRIYQLRLVLGGLLENGSGKRELGPALLVLFEGWDASGKGGAIKRLVDPLDPRHVRVAQFSTPTPDEKRHHYLQRFGEKLPGAGGMSVFDRSWYGRVLVERVEGYATTDQWRRAYAEITGFEQTLHTEGMTIVKFWLHLSAAKQLERFEKRRNDPLKAWKLTDDDWRNRGRRPDYERALEDMLEHTDHKAAPWEVVSAESKHYARVHVIETACARIEQAMREAGIEPPKPL